MNRKLLGACIVVLLIILVAASIFAVRNKGGTTSSTDQINKSAVASLASRPEVLTVHRDAGARGPGSCRPCHGAMTSDETPWHKMHLGNSIINLTCSTCHKKVTLGPRTMAGRVLIDRTVCVKCHREKFEAFGKDHQKSDWVKVHRRLRGEAKGGPIPLMAELEAKNPNCFICHGRKELKFCGECHEAHDHNNAWVNGGHGPKAVESNFTCLRCHDKEKWCTTECHEGVTLPHNIPKWSQFWQNQPEVPKWRRVHFKVALDKGIRVCQRCHKWSGSEGEKNDFCMRCHHQQFYKEFPEQLGSPWIKYAMKFVKNNGASRCWQCHLPEFCVTCHTTGHKPPPGQFFKSSR